MSPGPAKQFDREQVLEDAMQLFWKQGYEATGMTQLLEHVHIGRQSLYDTFGDKRGLFVEALAHYFRTRMGPMMAQLRAPGSPMGNVEKVVGMMEQMAGGEGFHGCFVGNSAAEFAATDPEMADRLASYFRTVEDAFEDAFVRARDAGEISKDVVPRDLARVFVHTMQGVAVVSQALRDPEIARQAMVSSLALVRRL